MKPAVLLCLPFLVLSVAQLNKGAIGEHERMAQTAKQKKAYACMIRSRITTIDRQIERLAPSQNRPVTPRAQDLLNRVRQALHHDLRMLEGDGALNWPQVRLRIEKAIADADIAAGE